MGFVDFSVVAAKETSDQVADRLSRAGIRFVRRVEARDGGREVHVIAVHRRDRMRAEAIEDEARRREDEAFVRTLQFVRRPFCDKDMLIEREPNEGGYYGSFVHDGRPFDETKYRLVRGGWDHEHCYLCWAKVLPGEEWWATQPAKYDNEIGVCVECHARLLGDAGHSC